MGEIHSRMYLGNGPQNDFVENEDEVYKDLKGGITLTLEYHRVLKDLNNRAAVGMGRIA